MDRSYQLFLQRTWLVMVFILFAAMIWRSHPWDPLRSYDGMTALVTPNLPEKLGA